MDIGLRVSQGVSGDQLMENSSTMDVCMVVPAHAPCNSESSSKAVLCRTRRLSLSMFIFCKFASSEPFAISTKAARCF